MEGGDKAQSDDDKGPEDGHGEEEDVAEQIRAGISALDREPAVATDGWLTHVC